MSKQENKGNSELYGLYPGHPRVHQAVLRSIREMPFRDLVAAIEGEEAAVEMEQNKKAADLLNENSTVEQNELRGLDANHPAVQSAVSRRIREMPFRDLVAKIEGEEAAQQMERERAAGGADNALEPTPLL